jgi:hypothetical protein
MNAAIERKIIRWLHIVISIPIIGYIYGPVAEIPEAVLVVRYGFFPILVLSGLWLWKGSWIRRMIKRA